MLDRLLQVVACFDWIGPTASIAQNIAHGSSHTFLIPLDCGWSGGEIADLLRRHGIETWGHMVVNGHNMITVRQTQARFAKYLLDRAGLPDGGSPVAPSRRPPAGPRNQSLGSHKRTGRSKSQRASERAKAQSIGDVLREIGDIRIL